MIQHAARLVPAFLLATALAASAAALPTPLLGATCASADGSHRVAVVAQHSDGRLVDAPGVCVSFTSASVTGEQALQASGIEYQTYNYGGNLGDGVCQIDGEPPTPTEGWNGNNCLSSGGGYWGYFVSRGGGPWRTSSLGISNQTLSDGDAEGFHHGQQPSPPPSPAGVCPATAPSAAPTPVSTQRPTPASPIPGTTPARPSDTISPSTTAAVALANPSAAASLQTSSIERPPQGARATTLPAVAPNRPPPLPMDAAAWALAALAAAGMTALLVYRLA